MKKSIISFLLVLSVVFTLFSCRSTNQVVTNVSETTVEVDEDLMILNALVKVGAASSNREARQFVKGGSVMVNGEKVTDEKFVVAKANAYGEKATVIRRGKKKYFVINHK